jgi:hypothetical protein
MVNQSWSKTAFKGLFSWNFSFDRPQQLLLETWDTENNWETDKGEL